MLLFYVKKKYFKIYSEDKEFKYVIWWGMYV